MTAHIGNGFSPAEARRAREYEDAKRFFIALDFLMGFV